CPTRSPAGPNSATCPRCLGLPGALPVLNREAVTLALRAALALQCEVHRASQFARKSYFYPDLPKGYQITQHDRPLATNGRLLLPEPPLPPPPGDTPDRPGPPRPRRIGISRLHLEEDAGKSFHFSWLDGGAAAVGPTDGSLLDFDRCGVPLVEIVSEPELNSPAEASAFLKELRNLLRWLGVCDGNMEEGSFRCDANLSLRRHGEPGFGTRTELKNLNSFRHIRVALAYEARRQAALLARGLPIGQETRQLDPTSGRTVALRGKEEAHDYRYFPEPDLPELLVDEPWLGAVAAVLPELPGQRRERYRAGLQLPVHAATVLTAEKAVSDYFEAVVVAGVPARQAASWVMTELLHLWDGGSAAAPPVPPAALAELLGLLAAGELTPTLAKTVWEKMVGGGGSARQIVAREGLRPAGEGELLPAVEQVLAAHPGEVARYRAGKKGLLGFFVGQALKATGGKGDAGRLRELLQACLEQEEEGKQ
ncbi:MAG: Asp-tRNA(Asn)/Glu-tRNA(Gln) amidotransferase subunit GatB, partial [Deltaproteobacteria bacterium]|nr:Asp-tRNA(Asn)/Glu-tRNA(Gln) amidotransferase subunit GatB [Deltaproteobacteria bacterium]